MTDPRSQDEYAERFERNQWVEQEGDGDDLIIHMPCPCCGAADFAVVRLLDFLLGADIHDHCGACDRSAWLRVTRNGNSICFQAEQTRGPAAPGWATWIKRRNDA